MGAMWMGDEWVAELDRWLVPTTWADGWRERSRSSGGYDDLLAVIIHHAADSLTSSVEGTERYATTSASAPIGCGTGTRTQFGPRWHGWAAGATNTAGRGGPLLNSAGEVIALDSANRVTVNTEWMNTGTGEPWTDDTCDLYVRWVCAALSWCNTMRGPGRSPLGAGDVWAHFEWAPTRKSDPLGPCRWNGHTVARWNMDAFRSEVFAHLIDGPGEIRRFDPVSGRVPDPPSPIPEEDDMPLSDEDVQRIAKAVWTFEVRDSAPGANHGKPTKLGSLIGWIRRDAAKAASGQ